MSDPKPNRDTYTEYTGSVGYEKKFHQTHFQGISLKAPKTKMVNGVEYVWMFGEWRKKEEMEK